MATNKNPSYPLVSSNAAGNPVEMEVSIGRSLINSVFSISMFDYRRVDQVKLGFRRFVSCVLFLRNLESNQCKNDMWIS